MYKTIRQVYIDILVELVREEAPTLYIEDFLYYYNKAINEYMKKRYELFEMTQQLTDDLRFWKKVHRDTRFTIPIDEVGSSEGYQYRHLLNCIVEVSVTYPDAECVSHFPNTVVGYKATRMTSSVKAGISSNVFLKPKYFRPYFDILSNELTIYVGALEATTTVQEVHIEYLKQPKKVTLTEIEVGADTDTSEVLEFTDDVGDEITKAALLLILERGQSPRTQSHTIVNQSVTDSAIRSTPSKK